MPQETVRAPSERTIERRRAVAIAHHYRDSEGRSIAEIARLLGRSPATIKAYFYDPTGEKARAVRTHVVHLRLGLAGHEPSLASADLDDAQLEPTYAPRACAYEHAQRLIEVLSDLGHAAAVNVPSESAFDALECIGRGTA